MCTCNDNAFCIWLLYILTLNIRPLTLSILALKFLRTPLSTYSGVLNLGCVVNSVDPDQTPHSAASDLGQHCLHRPVYSKRYSLIIGTFILQFYESQFGIKCFISYIFQALLLCRQSHQRKLVIISDYSVRMDLKFHSNCLLSTISSLICCDK